MIAYEAPMMKNHEQTLISLAREKWDEEDGNHERTVKAVINAIIADTLLYKSIADEAIYIAAKSTVDRVRYGDRRNIISIHSAHQQAMTQLGHRLSGQTALMDYPVGNTRLGDATRKELEDNVKQRDKSIHTFQIETEWLRRIAKELKQPGSKVKHELVEADLNRIRRYAEKALGKDNGESAASA